MICGTTIGQTNLAQEHQKKTNYAEPNNWSIQSEDIQHEVDVFFVHPTTYGPPSNGNYVADLNDQRLNQVTDTGTINRMTAAFSDHCNVFAPRYRQVNIEVLSFSDEEKSKYIAIPVEDITAALTYYLEKLNQGRPFILASHSQGSYVLQLILLDNPNIIDHNQLVAAYMPGWTFTQDDLSKMKISIAQTAASTGGLIVWNTIGPNGSSPTLMANALCVNPLSWTSDTKEVPALNNILAVIPFTDGTEGRFEHFTSAKITPGGGLEIPTPAPEISNKLNMSMGPACYHRYDYDFFIENIVENVALRCNQYLKDHQPEGE